MVGPVLDWVHGFGHSSWIFLKIQYQVQIRSSLVLENFHDTTTRVVGASRRDDEMTLPRWASRLVPIPSSTHPESREGRYPGVFSPPIPHPGFQGRADGSVSSLAFRPSHRPQLSVALPAGPSAIKIPLTPVFCQYRICSSCVHDQRLS